MGPHATRNTRLSDETRAVIGAVLYALDIPHAASVGHDETRSRILGERVMHLVVIFHNIIRWNRVADLPGDLAHLREVLDERPATGYVTDKQARARRAAGATWSESVALDYRGPAVEDEPDQQDAHDAQDACGGVVEVADECDVTATVPGTWPDGEPAAVRDAAESDDRHAEAAGNVLHLASRGPVFRRLADEVRRDGQRDVADALTVAGVACDRLRAVLDEGGDLWAAVDGVHAAMAHGGRVVREARMSRDAGEGGDGS